MELTARQWARAIARGASPPNERVVAIGRSSKAIGVKRETWDRLFGGFGGIALIHARPIEVIPARTGGSRLAIPPWAKRQLRPAHGDTICITQREGKFFLKAFRVVPAQSSVPGCVVIDEFGRDLVTRHCKVAEEPNAVTGQAVEKLLLGIGRLRYDPIPLLLANEGRIGLLARREFNRGWSRADRVEARTMRQALLAGQSASGHWADSPAHTALRLIRLTELGATRRNGAVARAADWLLSSREPVGLPGLFMFGTETVRQFNKWKAAHSGRDWADPHPSPSQAQAFLDNHDILGVSNSFCELKLTWTSAVVIEALMRLGLAEHPRVARAINTLLALRTGCRWCGCGYYVACKAIRESSDPPDFNRQPVNPANVKRHLSWMVDWPTNVRQLEGLIYDGRYGSRAVGKNKAMLLRRSSLGSGDCTFAVHRGLSWHPAYTGSQMETWAALEWEWRQGWDGSWTGNSLSFVFTCLARLGHPLAAFVVLRSLPLLCRAQRTDGLWHEPGDPARQGWGRRLALPKPTAVQTTFAIVSALKHFGFLCSLRGE